MDKHIVDRSFEFAVRVVRVCHALEQKPGVGRELAKQLLRSGTSIGANVEEAQAGHSRLDFIAKIVIAQREARETRYWLRLLEATELVTSTRLLAIREEADSLVRILSKIVVTTRRRPAVTSAKPKV